MDGDAELAPKTIAERRMKLLSHRIRQKKGWQVEVADDNIIGRSKKEAPHQNFPDSPAQYVLEELKNYAALSDGQVFRYVGSLCH